MQYQQLYLFDNIWKLEMYDGYEVKNTTTILIDGGRIKLKKGQIFYFVSHCNEKYSIDLPNEYGGALGFAISENQFKEHFKCLNRKVYPKRKEIWNGKNWVRNPDFN